MSPLPPARPPVRSMGFVEFRSRQLPGSSREVTARRQAGAGAGAGAAAAAAATDGGVPAVLTKNGAPSSAPAKIASAEG